VYGNQQSYNPYEHPNNDDCGNGKDTSGKNILDKNPLSHDIQNTPDIQKSWVQHITGKFGNSAKSRIIYQLDNEVSNWNFMHRDVHPDPVTYPEIVAQTIAYASAVKQADPTAEVAAPSEIQFGWYSDWGADKNVTYFLQQLANYEKQHGQRILDTYDAHYPDADDGHWPKLRDVAHLRQVVDQTYPGTKISFSEWSLSQAGALNGALAVADQLGHYAANQIAWASFWGLGGNDLQGPISFTFRMFRNYDGHGSTFGDEYVSSATSDDSTLSVHAAIRKSDGALTILVINKIGGDQQSNLNLRGFNPKSSAQVYQFSAGNEKAIVSRPAINVSSNGFTYSYAAFSLTLIVVSPA